MRELKRLESILAEGKKGRDPKQPDIYDRMLLERRGVHIQPNMRMADMHQHWKRDKVSACVVYRCLGARQVFCHSLADLADWLCAQSGVTDEDIGMRRAEGVSTAYNRLILPDDVTNPNTYITCDAQISSVRKSRVATTGAATIA